MSQLKPEDSHVLLCDWRGRLTWSSREDCYEKYGELVWDYAPECDREKYRQAFARATTLKTRQQVDSDCICGNRFRAWLWPLSWPDTAVCVLATRIPAEMALLTPREHECLEQLAFGLPAGEVAAVLDISASTVHTLMRRARKKLQLRSISELISFAARYCFPKVGEIATPSVLAKPAARSSA